jgi:hypothetical protein
MDSCPKCGAQEAGPTASSTAFGAGMTKHGGEVLLRSIYSHIPHPHIEHRKKNAPKAASEQPKPTGPIGRFNKVLGVKITEAVGTMWCAYIFAALALVSLPEAYKGGTAALVAWIAQTFIQLVLLSIIMVGQKIAGEATDKRAIDTYNDAEAVLHEAIQIQQHLAAQDAFLKQLINELVGRRAPADSSPVEAGTTDQAPSIGV